MSNLSEKKVLKEKKNSKFKMPHTYVLCFGIILLAVLLTHVLPAGTYHTVEINGRSAIDASSFEFVEQNPATFEDFILSIPTGLTQSAQTVFNVFLIGGFFFVINSTGAIDAAIAAILEKLKDKSLLVIPCIMLFMYIFGFLGIVVEATVAFIPIGLSLARRLKIDPLAGMSIFYLPIYAGMVGTPMGPYTTLVAQDIAGLVPFSGAAYRTVFSVIIFVVTLAYVYNYAKKVQKNPEISVLGTGFTEEFDLFEGESDAKHNFSGKHLVILITVIAGFAIYSYGATTYGWGSNYLVATMFLMAIISGAVARMSPNTIATTFIEGAEKLTYGALMVGLARAISVILTDGMVIHTVIYYLSMPLANAPSVLSAIGMFLVNLSFNFFVPSGPGQAAIVMPIIAPLSDIVGVTRQVAVSCFQYGDGMSNIILPTVGTIMACLGIANIPYEKWVRYVYKLFFLWVAVAIISVSIGVIIGWS